MNNHTREYFEECVKDGVGESLEALYPDDYPFPNLTPHQVVEMLDKGFSWGEITLEDISTQQALEQYLSDNNLEFII